MTARIILALTILVVMITLIMFDIFPFGTPPFLARMLLVTIGLFTVPEASAGFTNSSVTMIASFMVVLADIQRARTIDKVKDALISLVNRGSYKSYALLVIVVTVGAGLVSGGNTGYYVLVLSSISTIPCTGEMPTFKLMMPLRFTANHPLIPINVALYYGVVNSMLGAAGFMKPMSTIKFSVVNFVMAVAFLVWSLVSYRLLPDHPIAATEEGAQAKIEKTKAVPMEPWKEKVAVIIFVVSVASMMLINTLGNVAYVMPGLAAMVLLFMKVVDSKELQKDMFVPVILVMAGVIGVADVLANSGFTTMTGEMTVTALGTDMVSLLVVILSALLTSTCAAFTGSNMDSVYTFAPIAIAACMSLEPNLITTTAAVVVSGWQGRYMPIDGMPTMVMGMGKYKLPRFWRSTVPMYLIRVIALSVAAAIIFPM